MAAEYDFIIVGSGPAGGALAYFLAQSPKKPKILILEAGSDNSDNNLRVDGKRWLTFMEKGMNYGYKTAPQTDANNREIDYSRGRGLGGSSAVNFGVFTVGAKHDYDEWSRLVQEPGGESSSSFFGWERTKARLKKLETFHGRAPVTLENNGTKYVSPRMEDHGSSGPLHVGYPAEWEDTVAPFLDQSEKFGFPLNPDHNSGNPLGMSALISSAHNGRRSTARDLLQAIEALPNVTILTSSPVQRLVFDPPSPSSNTPKVTGVESNGSKYLASREVILCAGSLDTPKILMHSGIGPSDQLNKFSIPIVHANEAIGQNLRDHAFCPLVYLRKTPPLPLSDRAKFYSSPLAQEEALVQWSKNGTGPWAKFACQTGIGFFKLGEGLTSSPEFLALPEEERAYLSKPTIPHWEVFSHFPIHWFMPEAFPPLPTANSATEEVDVAKFDYTCLLVFLYNAQARGSVTLQSSDPNVPLVFDPKFLSHPYDRRAAVEALREALRYTQTEQFISEHQVHEEGGVIAAPPNASSGVEVSDEELLGYWRSTISSSWHMSGTVKMGRAGEKDAVVDKDFKLIGVQGVRVADMSVAPVLLSGHTQAGAYLTGVAAAERILEDF